MMEDDNDNEIRDTKISGEELQNKFIAKKKVDIIEKLEKEIEELKKDNEGLVQENLSLKEENGGLRGVSGKLKEEEIKDKENMEKIEASAQNQKIIINQLKKRVSQLEDEKEVNLNESDMSGILENTQVVTRNSLVNLESKNDEENSGITNKLQVLKEENSRLKELIKEVQDAKVTQFKDTMELQIRIQSFEDEVTKSQQERYQLALDLDKLTNKLHELFTKVKESDEI
mmetsp:Transcript_11493/g.10159  ORF Transcript_11493/g.10159 Transcript_11493/m.10159 type:complete len:229 (+) Transcript_11493:2-688(+)